MRFFRRPVTPELAGNTEDEALPPSAQFPRIRPRTRFARRFYARYVDWTERLGYTLALLIIGGVVYSFFRPAEDTITGSGSIVPRAESVKAARPVRVTRVLVTDLAPVVSGAPLVEVADAETGTLSFLTAPAAGLAHVADDLTGKEFDADAAIAEVLDPNDLRITTRLNGETVAAARTGQKATITGLIPDHGTGVVLRADVRAPGGAPRRIIASGALDKSVRTIVRDALKDRTITRRDDLPFPVTDVTEVEVSTDLTTAPARAASDLPLDPSPLLTLDGAVAEGKHSITVQISDLPAAVRERVEESLRARLRGRGIAGEQIEQIGGTRVIARVTGEQGSPETAARSGTAPLVGNSLERAFEATIRVTGVPDDVRQRILRLYADGHPVRGSVRVATGTRPLALTFLKK